MQISGSWCGDKYVDSICNCRRKSYIFLKEKKNVLALCILSVPYTKLLFDGGTINNMIFGLATCILAFAFSIFLHWIGVVLHGYGSGDIHFTKRKSVEDRTDEENI